MAHSLFQIASFSFSLSSILSPSWPSCDLGDLQAGECKSLTALALRANTRHCPEEIPLTSPQASRGGQVRLLLRFLLAMAALLGNSRPGHQLVNSSTSSLPLNWACLESFLRLSPHTGQERNHFGWEGSGKQWFLFLCFSSLFQSHFLLFRPEIRRGENKILPQW